MQTEEIKGYEEGEMPTEKQIAEAIETLVQVCTLTGGLMTGAVTRTKEDGTLVGTFHFDMHDSRLCQHEDMLFAEPIDKHQVN